MMHKAANRPLPVLGILFVASLLWMTGCASGGGTGNAGGVRPRSASPRPGTQVVALEFVRAFDNVASAPYYPIERLTGCTYSSDGTLIFCDEGRGKVYGLESGTQRWYEFDGPISRPYTPVDVQVDGFKVLVLDSSGGSIYRYDLSGSWQDKLLDVQRVDPAVTARGVAFDVDRDGRMIIADENQQQGLLMDAFLSLNMRLGEPGTMDDQFSYMSGTTFLPDGSILFSDAGNRRLSWYGRLGFFEGTVGGVHDPSIPFVTPAGLDSDRFGNVFVADSGSGLIHILDSRLRLVYSAGQEFALNATPLAPVDVAVSPEGMLAVTDQARSAVLVYRIVYE